jgi:hypothetical protein
MFECSDEQKRELKSLAKQEGCCVKDFLLSRALNITLKEQLNPVSYTTKKEYVLKRKRVLPK